MYLLIPVILTVGFVGSFIWFARYMKAQKLITDKPAAMLPQDSEEMRRIEKRLRLYSVIYGVTLLLDVLVLVTTRRNLSIASIGLMLLKLELIRCGWHAVQDQKHLKSALSAGLICSGIFLWFCFVQGMAAFALSGAIDGITALAEMLVYTVIAWDYYKLVKRAGGYTV